jgi:hypothetical protein
MIGFSEVTLTEQTVADYADTLAYLGAAIRLYLDTFRRLGLLDGEGQRGRPERRRATVHGQGRRAVQGHPRLPATPVVLD